MERTNKYHNKHGKDLEGAMVRGCGHEELVDIKDINEVVLGG